MIAYLHFAPSGEDPDFAPDFRLGFGVRPVDVETDDIRWWVTRIIWTITVPFLDGLEKIIIIIHPKNYFSRDILG